LAKVYGKEYVASGFILTIRKKSILPGEYSLGVIVARKNKIKGFKFTKIKLDNSYIVFSSLPDLTPLVQIYFYIFRIP